MRSAVLHHMGQLEYGRALDLQHRIVENKIQSPSTPDHLIMLEHPPVFTLGKRGGRENLVVTAEFLQEKQISIFQTERGGNITFHGPGQVVFYPIINIEQERIGVKDFVHGLEQMIINSLDDFGIISERSPKNHGVWVNDKKIASVGISIRHGITFHGIALNATMDLTPFSWINPCGMANVKMTSILKERVIQQIDSPDDPGFSLGDIQDRLLEHFELFFNYSISQKNENNPIQ